MKFFWKDSMCQPVLSLIHIFQKMLEIEIKHELLMETYKESLKGQYGSDCIIFWSEFVKNIGKEISD